MIINEMGITLEQIHEMGITLEQILVLSVAGSHMYGLSTDNSDKDYLGVYIPTKEQLLLNNFPHHIALPKESGLDLQIWSLHYFMKLACQGETMAIDLIHSPDDCIIIMNDDWIDIQKNKKMFYTKEMKSFVSYARKQAAKYGLKGDRIKELQYVSEFLQMIIDFDPGYGLLTQKKLKDIWEYLPNGEHIHFLEDEYPRMYQVCGKKYQETVTCSYALKGVEKTLTDYGKRAILAKQNDGVDWKAVSHALRGMDQIYDILTEGEYSYPLKNAVFIKEVKLGKYDFSSVVQPVLEEKMNAIESLIEKSNLRKSIDKEYWNKWLISILEKRIINE